MKKQWVLLAQEHLPHVASISFCPAAPVFPIQSSKVALQWEEQRQKVDLFPDAVLLLSLPECCLEQVPIEFAVCPKIWVLHLPTAALLLWGKMLWQESPKLITFSMYSVLT